jgi:hypothetical protein
MPKFLIEVPHEAETVACAKAVQVLMSSGSHYLTNADYGCRDGDHRGWLVVEVDDRDEARSILPPVYRTQAKIVQLNRFSLEELDQIIRHHK